MSRRNKRKNRSSESASTATEISRSVADVPTEEILKDIDITGPMAKDLEKLDEMLSAIGRSAEPAQESSPEKEIADVAIQDTADPSLQDAEEGDAAPSNDEPVSEFLEEYAKEPAEGSSIESNEESNEESIEESKEESEESKEESEEGSAKESVEKFEKSKESKKNSDASWKVSAAWVLSAVAVLVILLVLVKVTSNRTTVPKEPEVITISSDAISQNNVIPVPTDPLLLNAYPEVNALVERYFKALQEDDIDTIRALRNSVDSVEIAKIQAKSRYVESYENIACYTKAGPYDNSYIVYTTYDVRFQDWEQTAPSLLTLFICPDENGQLCIYTGDFDEKVATYIVSISSQQDVMDLLTKVDTQYKEIMDSDEDFSTYMGALNQLIRDDVSTQLAAEETLTETQGSAVSDNSVSENEPEETSDAPETFEVVTNTTVNVRVSDSEAADRLGKVEEGTHLTCYAQQPNGWSKVAYEGDVGYIKSEFLSLVREDGSVEPTVSIESGSRVTIAETVNVRATASLDGERLGVAYEGDRYEVLSGDNNGWTKIAYDGQEGYVKTEFLTGN